MKIIGYFEIQSSTPGKDNAIYKAAFDWNFIKEEYGNAGWIKQ